MRTVDDFSEIHDEVIGWRRHLHQYPELGYNVHNTARFVADKLASFGINHIETGIAETGVVAVIQGNGGDGPTIGLRADMDALPIMETTGKPWASKIDGKMHACGHDGHTAMLLGAGKYLAATRNFKGSVALIFQPAEEDGQGAGRMVQEGLMDRFNISQIFGMHNMPGIEVGKFGIRDGSIMAALDEFDIIVTGRGGHAATPHVTIDPVVVGAQIITALQTLVSRNLDPTEALVVSVPKFTGSESYHIIPDTVTLGGTVRSLSPTLRDFAEKQIRICAENVAAAFGAMVEYRHRRLEPLTFNQTKATEAATAAAKGLVGPDSVNEQIKPVMVSEDFAYMLQARPGAFLFLGNGATAGLHNPGYDFDDTAIPYGIGYWVNLVEANGVN
ncbi:M20 aminoacylase family protein [Sinorhizobium meliloti]|uniref:M20 aminoacylase family protein n=1 Tax=Rhizobium meliloti TaxID=382 RepID=UPI00129610B6|nr:M20 aminoacylase family protein [Sinorhizobium meliloti]MQU71786.1 amidohydrolase [Sinorhizobium meliloti]